MRLFLLALPPRALLLGTAALGGLALLGSPLAAQTQAPPPAAAQSTPPAAAPAGTPGGPAADPVVARVNGQEIRFSELRDAAEQLPDEVRGAPPSVLYPLILDQLVAQKALVAAARAEKLDQDPDVRRRVARAEEQELQQALLRREVAPALTDEALRRRFEAAGAARQGEEEVHARHILVANEADARAILAEVKRPGVDFAEVARRRSTGPGAQQGGDLGFFKKGDMIPEFAEVAFALQPGQIADAPVRTTFGWHVIKVEERRAAPAPSFEESREQLRQAAFDETLNAAVERYRSAAQVERFNLDGSPIRAPSALDGATPPPAAAPPTPRR